MGKLGVSRIDHLRRMIDGPHDGMDELRYQTPPQKAVREVSVKPQLSLRSTNVTVTEVPAGAEPDRAPRRVERSQA